MKYRRVPCPGGGVSGLESQPIDKGWQVRQVDKEFSYPVRVPGNVRLALMEAGVIPDPFKGQNNEQSKWVSEVEWEYINAVQYGPHAKQVLDRFPSGGLVHVGFDAIDYDATFRFDDHPVCRQVGMFSPVGIAQGVPAGSKIEEYETPVPIAVRFHVQPWWRQHAVKCQMAFGWDFAPELRTVGIWKPVRVHATGPAFFSEIRVLATPAPTWPSARVTLAGKVAARDPATLSPLHEPREATLRGTINGEVFEQTIQITPDQAFTVDLGVMEIPAWNPWSLGSPVIVPAVVQLVWDDVVSDEARTRVVNRQVSWARNPGTPKRDENWTLVVNGAKMFLRGINWVPPDALFGRIPPERYHQLVDAAIDIGVDMLRMWGGGIEEHPAFYEYCDETGMLVWQEFPYACTNYPRYPQFMAVATRECTGIVERTRRHPSVVVYCGGNEFNPYINRHIVDMCTGAVSRLAPDCHCFAVSPFRGDDHNWRVWGARRQFDGYEVDGTTFQMLTEYGMQAAPALETLAQCLGGDENARKALAGPYETIVGDLEYHKMDPAGMRSYVDQFGENCPDAATLVKLSQAWQAYGLKYAIEVCRANWPNVSGVFPWQLDDPWPNVSWSVVDYYFRPKLAATMLRVSYAPVLPMVRGWQNVKGAPSRRKGTLIVHNATQTSFEGNIRVEIARGDDSKAKKPARRVVFQVDRAITVSPGRPLKVGTVTVEAFLGTVVRLALADEKGTHQVTNISYPAMEPPISAYQRFRDQFDARFDAWWRRRMTKLMEVDRIREEVAEWTKRKQERNHNT